MLRAVIDINKLRRKTFRATNDKLLIKCTQNIMISMSEQTPIEHAATRKLLMQGHFLKLKITLTHTELFLHSSPLNKCCVRSLMQLRIEYCCSAICKLSCD